MADDTPLRSDKGDEMSGQFDCSVAIVRDFTSRVEQILRPVFTNGRVFLGKRPVFTTFVTIFCFLTILPVVFFLGLSVFTFTIFVTGSLGVAVAISTVLILAFLAVLISISVAAFFLSILLTFLAIASFVLFRFVVLLSLEGQSGVAIWIAELRRHLFYIVKGNQQNEQITAIQDNPYSDPTKDSGILIQTETPLPEAVTR